MSNSRSDYVCPRCLYSTSLKSRIKQHFEKLKKPCSAITPIELTDDVKDFVVKNHVYTRLPEVTRAHLLLDDSKPTFNQTVNNFNNISAIVSSMESLDKLKMIVDHQKLKLPDFEDRLESDFQGNLERMDNDQYPGGYTLDHDGLLKLVDGATKMSGDDLNEFSLLFDKTINRIKILSCGQWDTYLEELGVKEVIKLIKSYFLDSYELYLIKHMQGNDINKNRFHLREHLNIYYKFISTFDLDAIVTTQTDRSIVGYDLKENNDYHLANHYGKIFMDIKKEAKIGEKNKLRRTVTNIVKENTTHNVNKLNKIMLDLLKTDENFLKQLIDSRRFPVTV